jgi:hypothetical protein
MICAGGNHLAVNRATGRCYACGRMTTPNMLTPIIFEILYPDHRFVTGATILAWARDHLMDAGGATQPPTLSVAEAIELLSDAGLVTFSRRAKDRAAEYL